MSLRQTIHDHIISLIKGGEFFEVSFDSEDSLILTSSIVVPESIAADETSSSFITDPRMGLSLQRKRSEWIWQAKVKFGRKVSCEAFEEDLLNNPPKVQTTENPPRRCVIELISSTYNHGIRKSDDGGDSFSFEFSIRFF